MNIQDPLLRSLDRVFRELGSTRRQLGCATAMPLTQAAHGCRVDDHISASHTARARGKANKKKKGKKKKKKRKRKKKKKKKNKKKKRKTPPPPPTKKKKKKKKKKKNERRSSETQEARTNLDERGGYRLLAPRGRRIEHFAAFRSWSGFITAETWGAFLQFHRIASAKQGSITAEQPCRTQLTRPSAASRDLFPSGPPEAEIDFQSIIWTRKGRI